MTDIDELRALAQQVAAPEPDFGCSDFAAANWYANKQAARDKLADAVPGLIDQIQSLRSAQQWRGIESAPRDGTIFDVWVPTDYGGYRICNLSFSPDGRFREGGSLRLASLPGWPSHWMPSPAAPLPATGADQ